MRGKLMGAVGALSALLTLSAQAVPFMPGLVTFGSKHDKGVYELAYVGAERFKKAFGAPYLEVQVIHDAQYEQAVRALARRHADPVLAVGPFAAAVKKVAREFPKTRFVLIDSDMASGANIQSVYFREHEGSFLVGMAAAMKSQTGTIGFIGGMGLPQIRSFGCGYLQGARYVDPKVKLIQNMAGTTKTAFLDPARGAELARSQFDRRVDVVFAAAGMTTLGVLQQAKRSGKLAIGVDSNQNGLYPGTILTSMVKRVDNAVYGSMLEAKEGHWQPGIKSLGLKEGGVDWALDAHNRSLITPAMAQRINRARAAIIADKIPVVDYRTQRRCPVQ